MSALQFWLHLARAVFLPAALTLLVLVVPPAFLLPGWGLVYLVGITTALAVVIWRTVVCNSPPRILTRLGF